MLINVNNISAKGLSVKDSLEIDEQALVENNSQLLEKLTYQAQFHREDNRIKVQGRIRTVISIPCARCMDHFELNVNSRFDVILFPTSTIEEQTAGNLNTEDLEYIFYEGEQIDLDKILIEQINLYLPQYPLCQPDCHGLCQKCGTNLNHSHCPCSTIQEQIKFSFEKLKR